jgi:hypothetical protein
MWMDADSDEEMRGDDCDASRDEAGQLDDDRAYWRRRFVILCGGVVALGVCAWLFPGAHPPSAHQAAATRASMAALAKQQAPPAAAYGSAWPGRSKPAASPTATAKLANPATAKLANSAKKAVKKVEKPSPAFHPSRPASAAGGSPCAPADIVLSLLTSRPSYARGERPSFSVYAVSTAAAACTLTYGAGSVQVVVTRHGHVVWDSATCERSAAAPVRFTLGVPQVVTLVWNPGAARPAGCAGSLPAGASGTLDAVAMSYGQSSPVRAFKIGGLPA